MNMDPSSFFTPLEKQRIAKAIEKAEKSTSGEIRVHIESRCSCVVLDRAAELFGILGMHKTAQRNGVLIYLALDDRQFAIIGDGGINSKVPEGFWDSTRDIMAGHFREGRFADGLEQGILMAGEQLKNHFPFRSDDVNELKNDVSYGD